MEKNKAITALEQRVKEQQMLQNLPFAPLFLFITSFLGENPWRIILPLAILLTLLFHVLFGRVYDEIILWLFSYL